MTIDEVVKELGVKRSTVEKFRDTLIIMGLLKPGKSLKARDVAVFKHAHEFKESTKSKWSQAFKVAIERGYSDELMDKVTTQTPRNILTYLTLKLDKGSIIASKIRNTSNDEDSHVVNLIISNLKELGYKTKGKDIQSFSLHGSSDLYYLITIKDLKTNKSETHLFYNSSPEFNVMRCTRVAFLEQTTEELNDLIELCEKECL